MPMKLTEKYGKPVCVALYALFSAMAVRKKPLPLLILVLLHYGEYCFIGKKIAAERGLTEAEGLAQCMSFGFTWWLPLKNR